MKRLREAALMIALLSGAFGLSGTKAASAPVRSTDQAETHHTRGKIVLEIAAEPPHARP